MESKHNNSMAMSSLMSPPEATPYERFSQGSPPPTIAKQAKPTFAAPLQFLSPPVSPETLTSRPDTETLDRTARDPILYPSDSTTTSHPPLFALAPALAPPTESTTAVAHRLVDQHILSSRARRKQLFRASSPPQRADYVLALEFKSQVMRMYSADRAAWMHRERQFLLAGQRARVAANPALTPRAAKKQYPALASSPTGVQHKARASARPPVQPRATKGMRERASEDLEDQNNTHTSGGGRSRNTGTSTREDKDFAALPDRCPPLSSLPARANSLKVEWKGAPLDLSADPHLALLHADEALLAANLRLDCATYLTSKRRIFAARLDCYTGAWAGGGRGRKEFRKTDAQQACKIDVNKASKLWMAFERVGWLDEKWCREWV